MNSRFLASPGGRLANVALSLSFFVMAYAAFAGGTEAIRVSAAGIVAMIVGFVAATILSIEEFPAYALAITLLVPPTAFYYILGAQFVSHAGTGVASAFASVGVFVLVAGIVLGLRTPATTFEPASRVRAHRPSTSNAGA